MADTLDAARVSWKFYVSGEGTDYSGAHWSAFDAIDSVRFGPDWTSKIVSPASTVLKDAASGKLSSVSWVMPDLAWSDDPSQKSDMGPSWVAAVVNAIGTGPQWDSTAIIILWSGWGGWYDDAAPQLPTELMESGLGIRVPCIIISPFAKKGVVTHELYQFGSLLRFVEESFDVPSLQSLHRGYVYTDSSSNSISHSLNLDQAPRAFVVIPAKYPPKTFFQHV
jgi:phospholipase C